MRTSNKSQSKTAASREQHARGPRKSRLPFRDDYQYLERYFQVCGLMMRKHRLLQELSEQDYRNRSTDQDIRAMERNVAKLNREIKRADSAFWEDLKHHPDAGQNHAIEKIASHYNLCLFQKKIRALL